MEEVWKDIQEFERLYKISDLGNVKSLSRMHKNNKNVGYITKEKVLKPRTNRYGYLQVCLYKNGNKHTKVIHRLVAQAFIPNPNNLPQVNHKDEDKTNDKYSNLEWCTRKYNMNYGTRTIRSTQKRSKKVYQYTKENKLIKEWPSISSCGNFGFNFQDVSRCCNGITKTHKGFIWSFKLIA